jgi:hypothetical protein
MAQAKTEALKVYDYVGPALKNASQVQLQTGAWVSGRFDITSYATGGESFAAELIGLAEIYSFVACPSEDLTGTAAQVVMRCIVAADRKSVLLKAYQSLDGVQATNTTDLGVWTFFASGKRLTETETLSP